LRMFGLAVCDLPRAGEAVNSNPCVCRVPFYREVLFFAKKVLYYIWVAGWLFGDPLPHKSMNSIQDKLWRWFCGKA